MSSRITRYPSSFLQSITNSCSNSNHPIARTTFKCQFASSSKNILHDLRSSAQAVTVVYDAPSQPSEHLTRRSARSPHSLSDYFSSRRRLSTRQTSSSTSSTALENSASSKNSDENSSALPYNTNVHSETFDSRSKPQAYYVRPQRKSETALELPRVQSRYLLIAVLTILGFSAWGGFVFYATNMERVSSSVVRQLYTDLKKMESVSEILGDGIRLEPKWWLGGEPWIEGTINMLQGKVDLRFRISGSKDSGTIYFTSVRKEKGVPFTILRYKLICDNGQIIKLHDLPH